ncbi:MAG: redox-regulated ATPase YchF [Planctomycetota bacterium]|jgi:GTP-binding protein YchF
MECGIVGLPGCGKTCLFRALAGESIHHAPAVGKPHAGVARIPDPRLDVIARYVPTRKVTPASIAFVDIPGIDVGQGGAKTASLLATVREVDAICEVVRCFESGTDPVNPMRDIGGLEDELILADLVVAESSLEKARKHTRGGDADAAARAVVLEKAMEELEKGRPVRAVTDWTETQQAIIRSYGLVSAKRVLYVANVGEDDLAGESPAAALVHERAQKTGGVAVTLCAELEAELSELDDQDRQEMLEGLGLAEPAIAPLARAVCRLLGLAVFYTTSEKEIRAWTVADGSTAPEAAGVVHTDMQRGFIRAECYRVDDLEELRSEKAIKAAGRLRTEGKGYHVRDGDVIQVLFSV